jgi:hypothetical protein
MQETPLRSASQVSLFRECKVKWALSYLAKLKSPSSPSQALGTEVDDTQLQPYLSEGRPFDYTRESGYIAAAGLAYLPKPGTRGLEVQKHFLLPSPSGKPGEPAPFGYQGYLDLWLPYGGMPEIDDGAPIVSDFKTSKDINRWAKTTETLKTDVQSQLYATWAMWETGARRVHLVWLYFQTQGAKKTKRVWATVDAAHVLEQFLAIDKTGQDIEAVAAASPPIGSEAAKEYALSLEPSPEMCGAYGGCPYQHICNLSPSQFIDSISPKRSLPIVATSTLDLFANLRKQNDVMGMSDRAVPAPPADAFAGINPPEKDLPPAPPIGAVTESTTTEAPKAKRGRKPKAVEVATEPATENIELAETVPLPVVSADDFDVAWAALGLALKNVLVSKGGK